jgi:hypothetical protein
MLSGRLLPYHFTVRVLRLQFILAIFLCGAPVWAQQSGVLLGIAGPSTAEGSDTQDFATVHEPQYQTLWIARDAAGTLKVLSTLPELIVPRRDGFWHVGVKQVCEFENKNESLRQVVWAAPVAKPGEVEQTTPCTTHKPEDYAPPYGRAEEDMDKISQCGVQLVNILYLSPELISTSSYSGQSEDCEPRGGHYSLEYSVRAFASSEPVGFGQLLGATAKLAYARALPKQGKDDAGNDCGQPSAADDTRWRIAHAHGRWHPYAHLDMGYFGCAADAPIRMLLPASLTGDAPSPISWELLHTKLPGAADFYLSPGGDLLIAAAHDDTRFYELRAGVPGKLLLKLPPGGIVMAQWATGTHLREWTEQFAKLAQQPLPAPVIRVKPAGP